jgi:hypothetical protein
MNRVTGTLTALIPVLSSAFSCALEPGDWLKETGDIDSRGGAFSVFEPSGDDGTPSGGNDGHVGDPCESNDDCITGYCMTTQEMKNLIKGVEVRGGYCSSLFCNVDGSDGTCTEAMGGICFSLYPFLPEFANNGICLAPCSSDLNCRSVDENICFDAQELVDKGLMSRTILDLYYSGGSKGCLPESVANAAIETLSED